MVVSQTRFHGVPLIAGVAWGRIVAANEPLSLWGGLDAETGEIIDRRHPLSGVVVAGKVLSIPFGRGSCSASGVLLEAIAHGVAPAAIVVSTIDPIIGLGAILGEELLGLTVPVLLVSEEERSLLTDGMEVRIDEQGWVTAGLG
jgi:predicted aconitase with swiveling domain